MIKCICGNKSFLKDGHTVFCSNCGRRLEGEKLKEYRREKKNKYLQKYYTEKLQKYLPGISISEIAIIKRCSRGTVYRHKNKFDLIPGYSPERYEFNDKVLDWEPCKKEEEIK